MPVAISVIGIVNTVFELSEVVAKDFRENISGLGHFNILLNSVQLALLNSVQISRSNVNPTKLLFSIATRQPMQIVRQSLMDDAIINNAEDMQYVLFL